MRYGVLTLCLLMFFSRLAIAQTSLNPDISVVGDFRIYSHDNQAQDDEVDKLNLADPNLEIHVGGYLNPYARADVIFGWHGEHNAEIEEAYATILKGLPLRSNLKVGKQLVEFGRLNTVHPHAYSFIKRPLVHKHFFGEEGLTDVAVRASFNIPTGEAFTELMTGLLKGDALLSGHDHEEETHESEEEEKPDLGFFGRLTTSMAVAESSELAIGASVVNAVSGFSEELLTEPKQLRSWLVGGDIKYKYKPSKHSGLQIESEFIYRQSETDEDEQKLTSYGLYGYIDYRFNQFYNIGGIAEYVRTEEVHHEGGMDVIEESDLSRIGLFIGWAPLEESSMLRLAGHLTNPDDGDSFYDLTLQLVIGLGPHQPHNF